MHTTDIAQTLAALFTELVDGRPGNAGPYMLNSGDAGLLAALDLLSAEEASRSANGGATIAAHALHVSYGLSLMNRWAREGGNPFADAAWDAAWKTSAVDEARWKEIREALRAETERWLEILRTPRDVNVIELGGMIGSIAHLAYHLGAIRQITTRGRGPKEGTFAA
jgi:hypothetical protein